MGEKKKVNKKIVILVLGIITLISVVGLYRSNTVQREGVYGIAIVYNTRYARGGLAYDFSYSYKGKEYKSYANSSKKSKQDEGKRFFIQILEKDPSRCFMTNIRVPDSITEAPYEGWKELPIQKQE